MRCWIRVITRADRPHASSQGTATAHGARGVGRGSRCARLPPLPRGGHSALGGWAARAPEGDRICEPEAETVSRPAAPTCKHPRAPLGSPPPDRRHRIATPFGVACRDQYVTTARKQSPLCSASSAFLVPATPVKLCVMKWSSGISPESAFSTSIGTASRVFQPPNAVPVHLRPVMNWNGRVAISLPAAATPMIVQWPQPRCAASSAVRMTSVLPVQSNVWSYPNLVGEPATSTCCIGVPLWSSGLMQSVHPSSLASANFFGLTSIPTIALAPTALAACTTAKPTAPRPKTATESPCATLAVFHTAPSPVATPQPKRHALLGAIAGLILAHDISAKTLYSANVEHPMKW
mmetsp:Transcript_41148/g.113092  ORF Transcript_41148/g.113092 Transcript_41148/m.113092 type:complete len:349 (-) Transcript_41148:500-1546(-)